MILALETATKVCSVAFRDEEGRVYERRIEKLGSHSEKLFTFIEELQKEHRFDIRDLDSILVSEGPGSYTGLRVSASAVKGLLFETDVTLYGIDTLAAFALEPGRELSGGGRIHSIIDARRVHVYHRSFEIRDGALQARDEVEVIPIEAFEKMVRKGDAIVGSGLNRLSDEVLSRADTYGLQAVSATSLIELFKQGMSAFFEKRSPESFEPKYHTSSQLN